MTVLTPQTHDTDFSVLSALQTAGVRLCCPVDEVCPIPRLEKKIRKERVCGCVCLWSSFVLLASVILSSGLFEEVESFLLVLASPG